MFNIGGGELIVIMLIALIVLGPQRLPDAARQVGKTMGDLRRLSSGFQNEMKGALNTADDPTRVAARRNVLAKEAPPDDATASSAVGAVSAQARKTPLKAATPKNGTAAKKPATARASAKPTATTKAAAEKVAAKKAPATKATAKKTPAKTSPTAKKATPAAKRKSVPVVSKATPRRTKA